MKLLHIIRYLIKRNENKSLTLHILAKYEGRDKEWHTETYKINLPKRVGYLLVASPIKGVAISEWLSCITVTVLLENHSLVMAYNTVTNKMINWSYN